MEIRPDTITPDRLRFDVKTRETEDGYGTVYRSTQVDPNPHGRALSSLLPDGMHAPVLDVDHDVEVREVLTARGVRSQVTVFGWFRRERALLALNALVDARLLDSQTLREIERLKASPWAGLFGTRSLQLTFPYEVVAHASKSARHHHLLCQTSMTWQDTRTLAQYLAIAGVADPAFVQVSFEGDFLFVNRPVAK